MNGLLRQYAEHECQWDGYPFAWAHETECTVTFGGVPVPGTSLVAPIKDWIREMTGHRCLRCGHPYRVGEIGGGGEWSPCDQECHHQGPCRVWFKTPGIEWQHFNDVRGFEGSKIEAQWRILTVHHLDSDKGNCRWWNLAGLCQRCHLRMQRAVVMGRVYNYEHSEWFKPFAAGFYAWKYHGEDLSREETMSRLDELLALEHRFTQETLL